MLNSVLQTDLGSELSEQCGLTGVAEGEGVSPAEQRGGLHM